MLKFSVFSSLALMVALAACSSKKEDKGAEPAAPTAAPQETQPAYIPENPSAGLIIKKDALRQFLLSPAENNGNGNEGSGTIRRDAITNKTFVFVGSSNGANNNQQPVQQSGGTFNGQQQYGGYYGNQQGGMPLQQQGNPFAGQQQANGQYQGNQGGYYGSQQGGMPQQQQGNPFAGQQQGGVPQQQPSSNQNASNDSRVAYKFMFDENGELHVDVWVGDREYQTKEHVAYKFSSNEEVDPSSDEETNIRPIVIDNFTAESVTDQNSKLKFQDKNGGVIFLAKVKLSDDYTIAETLSLPATYLFIKSSGAPVKKALAKQDSLTEEEVAALPQ